MVAFAMTKEESAKVLQDVMRRNPPPSPVFPQAFSAFVLLLQLDEDSDEVANFAEQCGVIVIKDVEVVS